MPLSITLLTVLNSKRLQGHGISPTDQERILASMQKRAESILAEAAKPFAKAEMDFETRIETGNPGDIICKTAERDGFDMIVITQSGLSELEEILGGSVVRTVLNRCKIPVLLVKHSKEQLAEQKRIRAEKGLLPG